MARVSAFAIIFILVLASFCCSSIEGRKLLGTKGNNNNKNRVSSAFTSLVLASLPKGTVPNSSPSKKGHATFVSEKLFVRHLADIHPTDESVPSPGAGH
ncbi:precursor of CEP14-like [Tripterygium wilfordii]|uniref:precursor of CEP14-like n=1 Tax=Tripterygium wilfordii TaxID=458696 RepID=UPI0018F7E52D|nr:precursor of CEP14-like [Tripterygium wilfordii]